MANQNEDENDMVTISKDEWMALRTEAAILGVLRTTFRNLCSDEYADNKKILKPDDKIEPPLEY